jgi:hypothetical protein
MIGILIDAPERRAWLKAAIELAAIILAADPAGVS